MRPSIAPDIGPAHLAHVASGGVGSVAAATTEGGGVQEEALPRFGLRRAYSPVSFLYAASALCLIKILYSAFVTSAATTPDSTFDPYLNVVMEVLQLGVQIWIFFLHHRAKVSLGTVLGLAGVVLPLGFAIGIRCLILVLSRTQYPTRLNNFVVVPDTSVPTGLTLDVGVDVNNFAEIFPQFADIYTYGNLSLAILTCLRQQRHPFLCEVTPSQNALVVVLGVFNGASLLMEKQITDADTASAVVSLVVGLIFLAWRPVVMCLDRGLIQLRHRKHDWTPQPVSLFYGLSLVTAAVFTGLVHIAEV